MTYLEKLHFDKKSVYNIAPKYPTTSSQLQRDLYPSVWNGPLE